MYPVCIYLKFAAALDEEAGDNWDQDTIFQVQSNSFIDSTRCSRVVVGPYHGPGVDVVQLAPGPLPPFEVAHSPREAGLLATGHAAGDSSVVTRREQGKTAEDV